MNKDDVFLTAHIMEIARTLRNTDATKNGIPQIEWGKFAKSEQYVDEAAKIFMAQMNLVQQAIQKHQSAQ